MMAEATDDATNNTPSHVRDATRSASDVGCIMRILRILFALDGRGRRAPSWGLRCALRAALPCHDLHYKCSHALPRDFVPGSIFASAFCSPFSLNSRCNLLLRPAI